MTHPELIQLESLVSRLGEAIGTEHETPPLELAGLAREYADACARANQRFQLCLDILSKGADKEHQALMEASRPPDLLDCSAILGELQSEEYSRFCRENHFTPPVPLNERAKQAVDPLYARAGTFQKRLRMEFSAANSKRDFKKALVICRQLVRLEPGDAALSKQAVNLEDKLVNDILSKTIGPALDKGDDEAVVAALSELDEIAPGRRPRPDIKAESAWIEALAVREEMDRVDARRGMANCLQQAEAARDANNLSAAVDSLARIGDLQARFGISLEGERAALHRELATWRDAELRKSQIERNFQAALDELKTKIKLIGDKEFRHTPQGYEESRADALDLQRLWKEVADYKKPVDTEIQEKAAKLLSELTGITSRHEKGRRTLWISSAVVGVAVVVVLGLLASAFQQAGQASRQLTTLCSDGRAIDLEKQLQALADASPRWADWGSLPEARSRATAWLEQQKAETVRAAQILASIREDLALRPKPDDWDTILIQAMKSRIEGVDEIVAALSVDYRKDHLEAIESVKQSLSHAVEGYRQLIITSFHDQVATLDELVKSHLHHDAPVAEMAGHLDQAGEEIAEMEIVAGSGTEDVKPSASDLARYAVLKERVATVRTDFQNFENTLAKTADTSSLADYLQAIREFNHSPFIKADDKRALSDLIVSVDSEDRILREILMPGDLLSWPFLKDRKFAADAYPDQDIDQAEESQFLKLRDDQSLGEIHLYTLGGSGKQSRKIYVRGQTMTASNQGDVRILKGTEVYDPDGGGASMGVVSFIKIEYREGIDGIPTGGSLSPESEFFARLDFRSYTKSDFSGFQKSFLEMAEQILDAPDSVSLAFRAYLFLEIGKLMQKRPEKWLLNFCNYSADYDELVKITGTTMRSSDWCSPATSQRLRTELTAFFEQRKGKKYLRNAQAVHQLYARVHTAGLTFCGAIDPHRVPALKQVPANVLTLWGLDDQQNVEALMTRQPGSDWATEKTATKFSPLFYLEADPETTWQEVCQAYFVSPDEPELLNRLPVKFRLIKEIP